MVVADFYFIGLLLLAVSRLSTRAAHRYIYPSSVWKTDFVCSVCFHHFIMLFGGVEKDRPRRAVYRCRAGFGTVIRGVYLEGVLGDREERV